LSFEIGSFPLLVFQRAPAKTNHAAAASDVYQPMTPKNQSNRCHFVSEIHTRSD
jgi:hypothetical protein